MNMESASGENSEININLKVISQINEGDKLFVTQNLLQIDRSQRGIANASVRWYNNESRQQTMIQLNKIIRKAFEFMNSDRLIAQNLESSLKGLIELRKTYIDDPTVVAQIDVLMEEIKEKKIAINYNTAEYQNADYTNINYENPDYANRENTEKTEDKQNKEKPHKNNKSKR